MTLYINFTYSHLSRFQICAGVKQIRFIFSDFILFLLLTP